jgi:cytochrome c peroxidase
LLLFNSIHFQNHSFKKSTFAAVLLSSLASIFCLVGCTSKPVKPKAANAAKPAIHELSPAANLGRLIFFDPTLSGSGRIACSSCHDPEHAYGPPNSLAVQLGGWNLDHQGTRAVPSLRYTLLHVPLWHQERAASRMERFEELAKSDNPPTGGLGWDGRFNTPAAQAAFPLLNPDEMANVDAEHVAAAIRKAPYAAEFRRVFGKHVLDDPQKTLDAVGTAVERFQFEDPSFYPFNSRFDRWLDGRVKLTEAEQRGLALFNDPARGNCASCHLGQRGADGSHPIFTDFQFEALGVPRNPELKANRKAGYYDMGLCGPIRSDQKSEQGFCGMFRTPTLRNVATRGAFFHNGRFHTLREALEFYVQRDTNPEKWYGKKAGGRVEKFDDIPAALRGNVDVVDEPLTRHPGQDPAWSTKEIDDVLAFLNTLTDADAKGPSTSGSKHALTGN